MMRAAAGTRALSTLRHLDVDVAVIGGGVMGAAAAWSVANRGKSCVLLEQFKRGHPLGSSHGDGRIIRMAYPSLDYVAMSKSSWQLWRMLEKQTSQDLLHETGGADIGEVVKPDLLDSIGACLTEHGLEHTHLDANAFNERYPQFKLPQTMRAIVHQQCGVLRADTCVDMLWRSAEMHGCRLLPTSGVHSVDTTSTPDCVHIHTNDEGANITAKKVIVATGAWTPTFLKEHFDVDVPIRVTQEQVTYYEPSSKGAFSGIDFSIASMPTFVFWISNGFSGHGFYGIPQVDVAGVKVATHYCGPEVDPHERARTLQRKYGDAVNNNVKWTTGLDDLHPTNREMLQSTATLVSEVFPHLDARPSTIVNCLYSITPDHDFIIDHIPNQDDKVIVLGGFSGHGFKFAPAVGEAAADLAVGGDSPFQDQRVAWPNMNRFRISRFFDGTELNDPCDVIDEDFVRTRCTES